MAFEFDRYVNGQLMAEGVIIEHQNNLPDAMRAAARIASRGPNGEAPVLVLRAEALSHTGAVKAALSGDTRELIDRMAAAIREDGGHYDDAPWDSLSDERKEGWRGDARRALAVVKEYLTARLPAEPVATIEQVLDAFDAETKTVPLGHENRQRGASTYNWRRAIADEIRSLAAAMIAAAPTPPKAGE